MIVKALVCRLRQALHISGRRKAHFITTPICYVNGPPHIGHLYSVLLGDVYNRWLLLNRSDTHKVNGLFSAGTDEHGYKIQSAAEAAGESPKEYTNRMVAPFQKILTDFDILCEDFNLLASRGHISKNEYSGWYCAVEEAFYTAEQVQPSALNPEIMVSISSGREVKWVQEQNYMFEMAPFVQPIHDWITNSDCIRPSVYVSEALSKLSTAPVSVSRDRNRVQWGIAVPGDNTQTIYVWFDALINYLTVAGYGNEQPMSIWPPTCQFVGKDIIRFHLNLWPAMLLAAGLDLPKLVSVHGHWMSDGEKGNVKCPFVEAACVGTDALRYFLIRQGVTHKDANYSRGRVIELVNAELANKLGNLLQRSTATIVNPKQIYPPLQHSYELQGQLGQQAATLLQALHRLHDWVPVLYEVHALHTVVDECMTVLGLCNAFFDCAKPWNMVKHTDHTALCHTLAITYQVLTVVSIYLQPIVPGVSQRILDRLNVNEQHRTIQHVNGTLPSAFGTQHSLGLNTVPQPFPRIIK